MAFSDLLAAADRAALTHLGGVDVVYQPNVGDPVTVDGIFDELVLDPATGQLGPAVFLRVGDLPGELDGDDPTLTIAGNSYTVRGRILDSQGGVHVSLVKVT